ncbi:hypothetical protein B0H14DRAFT_2607844 [Mycena olivaceomarginata]|nr:hypothetical protein B0H14DRAFT_2607844 [Mycena olivaceomarginata]
MAKMGSAGGPRSGVRRVWGTSTVAPESRRGRGGGGAVKRRGVGAAFVRRAAAPTGMKPRRWGGRRGTDMRDEVRGCRGEPLGATLALAYRARGEGKWKQRGEGEERKEGKAHTLNKPLVVAQNAK